MWKNNSILIADRNPHIRDFLRRELTACGYNIRQVQNGKELLKLIYSHNRIDLLVLDPEVPGVEAIELARKIVDRIPQLPVVLFYTRGNDDISEYNAGHVFLVEKNGQSIDTLKAVIQDILIDPGIHEPSSLNPER